MVNYVHRADEAPIMLLLIGVLLRVSHLLVFFHFNVD